MSMPPDVFTLPFLKTLPLFSDLTEQEMDLLQKKARCRTYEDGSIIFTQGDPITSLYVLCQGTVQVFRDTQTGNEVTTDILIAGDLLGADEMINAVKTHTSSAKAIDKTVVIDIPAPWVRDNFKSFDTLGEHLLGYVSKRLHQAQTEREQRITMTAPQLIACYLHRLCFLYGFDPKNFDLPYKKTLIASRLGMALETFSRSLEKLSDHGITLSGNHVSIHDFEKSTKFVCSECSISDVCENHPDDK
jgi:CRP-like cAMP-binding protein